MITWILHFDGLCEPRNPGGHMVWAWALIDGSGVLMDSGAEFASQQGTYTNNMAEYYAIGFGLRRILEKINSGEVPDQIIVRGDSQLIIKQLSGAWACNKEHLRKLRDRANSLIDQIKRSLLKGDELSLEWIPREQNDVADALGRECYIKHVGSAPPERQKRAS